MKYGIKALLLGTLMFAVSIAATLYIIRSPETVAAQGDYPPMTAAGQVDTINGGGKRLLAVDNHGVLEGNSVSTFNVAQGSAIAPLGWAQGQPFPAWTQQIGEQVHITNTGAVAVKGSTGVLIQLNINTSGTGTLSVFDLASAGCTGTPATNIVAVITVASGAPANALAFNAHFLNGICVKTSVVMDLTAVYQ